MGTTSIDDTVLQENKNNFSLSITSLGYCHIKKNSFVYKQYSVSTFFFSIYCLVLTVQEIYPIAQIIATTAEDVCHFPVHRCE